MSLSKTLYPLLSIGSTQEDWKSSGHGRIIFDWDVKQLWFGPVKPVFF